MSAYQVRWRATEAERYWIRLGPAYPDWHSACARFFRDAARIVNTRQTGRLEMVLEAEPEAAEPDRVVLWQEIGRAQPAGPEEAQR